MKEIDDLDGVMMMMTMMMRQEEEKERPPVRKEGRANLRNREGSKCMGGKSCDWSRNSLGHKTSLPLLSRQQTTKDIRRGGREQEADVAFFISSSILSSLQLVLLPCWIVWMSQLPLILIFKTDKHFHILTLLVFLVKMIGSCPHCSFLCWFVSVLNIYPQMSVSRWQTKDLLVSNGVISVERDANSCRHTHKQSYCTVRCDKQRDIVALTPLTLSIFPLHGRVIEITLLTNQVLFGSFLASVISVCW